MAQTPKRLGLTRDQLASFLNDFEQIKQFEQLFSSVDQINNFSIDEVGIAADNAGSSANNALAQISVISQETDFLSLTPPDLGGTVTRVGLSTGATGLTVTGTNPITTSGTFTIGGTLNIANGGTGATTAPNARTNLGATTVGGNFFTLTNPSAITFPQINADNTVSALDAATFRTAIGAGTGVGTVTSVAGTGTVNGITLTGTVTTSGNITLGGTLSGVSLTTQVTGTLPVGNGGTGTATAFTTGSIIFAGASGVYAQDNANFNWDDTNNTFAVGRTATSNVRIYSKGGTTGSGAFQYYAENSAGTGCFGIRDDGGFYTGQASISPYNLTTAAAANLVVAADYYLYRSTSSARYKKNIVDYDRGLDAAMSLRPVYYEGRGEIDEGKRFAGFIAEEVYDSGLTEFVVLDEEGEPDALHYGNMTALLASAIKELGKRLKRIEAELGIEDGSNS